MVMKRVIALLISFFAFVVPVSAYTYPDDAPYMHVIDNRLGDVYIYFSWNPSNFNISLKDGLQPINVGSSGLTGYFDFNGSQYSVSFSSYQLGSYRMGSGVSSQTYTLDISEIIDTNIVFFSSDGFRSKSNIDSFQIYVLMGGCVLLCLLLLKR